MEIMDTLQRKGFERGIQQGMQAGIREGKHQEALEIAANLLLEKVNPKTIQKATGLSAADLEKLMHNH
jgi:predicted transposase/invertase (TIGR01784 family)